MEHRYLVWHKPRQTVLRPKVEGLSNDHHSKPTFLFELARLFHEVGNWGEAKRLLAQTLKLERRRGNNYKVAQTLRWLSYENRLLGNYGEGIRRAKQAIEIHERLCDTIGRPDCWNYLAFALFMDSSTLQKTRDSTRSTSSRRKAKTLLSANPTKLSALYTNTRARRRRLSIIYRLVSKSHPLWAGTILYLTFMRPWRGCCLIKTSSVVQMPTSNNSSYALPITCTTWVAQQRCRL